MSDQNVVLVAGRPYDLSATPFDAFVERHAAVLALLRRSAEVRILLIRPESDTCTPQPALSSLVVDDLPAPSPPSTRTGRLRRALRSVAGSPGDAASLAIADAVVRSGASRAVTLGPWLEAEYQQIFRLLPTLHMFEEDLARMPENAPQSSRARALRRVERRIWARALHQPRAVVYISPAEAAAVSARFPRSRSLWHPLLLDPTQWPVAEDASEGDCVLVVGQFAQPRNAEGLRDVLDELCRLPSAPPVRVVSGAGLHPCLHAHVEAGVLVLVGDDGDVYRQYRQAGLALVPARRMTGVKTTLLQAWAAGCPVVCFSVAADSVGSFAHGCVAEASTPREAASLLVRLLDDQEQRAELSCRARDVLREFFDPRVREAELLREVDALTR